MVELVNQVNSKLNEIIEEISDEVGVLTSDLEVVQSNIDSKIDEAKGYKISVDEYKENINKIESEIAGLESDLDNLKLNYGNKGLDAIVEVGTKEINNKIVSKQIEVSKQAQKINELTDRARTIKELLINLKKDKKEKKDRLDNLSVVLEYYKQEFSKIIEYSVNNVDSLVYIPSNDVEVNYEVPVMDEAAIDSPVFEEIESIDKDDTVEPVVDSVVSSDDNLFDDVDNQVVNIPEFSVESDEMVPVSDVIDSDIVEEEHIDDTISSLFAKDIDKNIDFKALSKSIDAEYDNVFGNGSSEDIDIGNDLDNNLFTGGDNTNIFDKYSFLDDIVDNVSTSEEVVETDIFGNDYKPSYDKGSSNDDIVNNFFITNKLDFNRFSDEDRDYIKKMFNPIGFSKIIEILRKHNIDSNGLYYNPRIFEMDASELDSVISKLLVSGQSTHNVSLVLNALSNVSLMDINDAISSYGKDISGVNITDIIIKAKHLNDMGGNK